MTTTAYLAAEGFEQHLLDELTRAGVAFRDRHYRLVITEGPDIGSAWAANTWRDVVEVPVASIGEAARTLKSIQRNWVAYAPVLGGRTKLVTEKLPHVSAKPITLEATFDDRVPRAPLGSFTLLSPDRLLASADCTSPFPNGVPSLVEDRHGPPSRAYLKLWEALLRVGRQPGKGDLVLDLGASPGGWTWLLARTGAHVIAVDKAPLDPAVDALKRVAWHEGSAFALDPADVPGVTWVVSDIICYPDRLFGLVERWLASGVKNLIATVKFQGETDHTAIARFRSVVGARVFHLHHNKHEVTLAVLGT